MGKKTEQTRKGAGSQTREDRLKAALKANIARRKAQTRERSRVQTDNREKE